MENLVSKMVLIQYPDGSVSNVLECELQYFGNARRLSDEETREYLNKKNKEDYVRLRISELKENLVPLKEKMEQDAAGEEVPDIDGIRSDFRRIHNEIRMLQGKEPRAIKRDKPL